MDQFNADLEMIDLLRRCVIDGILNDSTGNKLFVKMDRPYPSLDRMTVSDHNRKLKILHLRKSIYVSYIKDVYEETIQYFHDLLQEAVSKIKLDPTRIVGNHHENIDLVEILEHFYADDLTDFIVNKIYRKIENQQDTLNTIDQVIRKLGITLEENIKEEAVSYLQIRHILVHADGIADAVFRDNHTFLSYETDGKISINRELIVKYHTKICALVKAVDKTALEMGLIEQNTID